MLVYEIVYQQVQEQLEQVKAQLEQARPFVLLELLINFELRKYYQNEPKFNGVYSRNNLPEIKDRTCVINIDEYKSIGTN